MKALCLEQHGGPGALRYGDYPEPDCGPDDVSVRVTRSSFSGWDVKYRKGELRRLPGRKAFPLPMHPGRDAVAILVDPWR